MDQDPLPWREEIVKTPALIIEDGWVAPGELPGIGVDIDERALRVWTV